MIQEIAVLVLAYICLIGWANAPKHTTTTELNEEPIAAPVEATTSPPMPKTITEPLPKPAYTATAPNAIAVPKETTTTEPAQDLSALPIRKLYEMASAKGIKRYKAMNKAALVAALS